MLDRRLWTPVLYLTLTFFAFHHLRSLYLSSTPYNRKQPPVLPATITLRSANSTLAFPALPPSDYALLSDLSNFSFAALPSPCNASAPLLLVLVHSAPRNADHRVAIRSTWGANSEKVRLLFALGVAVEGKEKALVESEVAEFGDLLVGSFVDSYRNLTYKHAMVLKFVVYHCPNARYILKIDDDVFVNIPFMLHFLEQELSPYGVNGLIFCDVYSGQQPIRSWRSKWHVSFKEYLPKTYPPYCMGWSVLYSSDVVYDLYVELQKVPYFWIDDVLITGILAEKLQLQHVDAGDMALGNRWRFKDFKEKPAPGHNFLYSSELNPSKFEDLWKEMVIDGNLDFVFPKVLQTR